MADSFEKLIQSAYGKWKAAQKRPQEAHPDEESMACFLENRLPAPEAERIKAHLVACDSCAELLELQLKVKISSEKQVPEAALAHAKNLVGAPDKASILEIFLRAKGKTLELLQASGDVLLGQELVPAPALRSRQIKDFKDEVTILKDFQDIRVEAKIDNKAGQAFSLTVAVKEKSTQRILKDLRVTLIKDNLELESYLTDSGRVTFEHILLGNYTVEISTLEARLASILLEIKA
ncbi:MAG: hypothetical protein FJZ13_00490 [Candidatus Omnitrophica bacterium]|nr:hypothetical protein [Candidatus Omnitrophota bacterium]